MLAYQKTYEEFCEDIQQGAIVDEIKRATNRDYSPSEKRAFRNSLGAVKNALDSVPLPRDVDVAVEFKVPLTNKRIDFIISGQDDNSKNNVIIVELKQWEEVKHTDMEDIVLVLQQQHVHPSWQAYSYGSTLTNFNEYVQDNNVNVSTCTFLHNYRTDKEDEIKNDIYSEGLEKAPAFIENEWLTFAYFINSKIKKKSGINLLYYIEKGRIKASKFLVDTLSDSLNGNTSLELIDEQRIVKSNIKAEIYSALQGSQRKVIIVKGGAGTGKSLIALQLLGELYKDGRSQTNFYVAKSSYIKESYFKKLTRNVPNYKFLKTLFRGSGDFFKEGSNIAKQFDCLIVDEAHRLTQKTKRSFLYLGNNQIQEIIHASKVSVFFIDETQQIDIKDYGTIENIKLAAEEENALVIEDDDRFLLHSQFRCNGSDDYVAWVESVLYNKEYNRAYEMNNYDIQVFDNISEMYNKIVEKNNASSNPSRMLSGDVFPWISMNDKSKIDINIDDFHAQWNLKTSFAVDPHSINEVGCIHTAQGMEFEYAGLIVGNDLIYRNGKVQTDYTKHPDGAGEFKRPHQRTVKEEDLEIVDKLIRNTYKVLFTRGQKGLYLYIMDDALRDYLKERIDEFKND